MRSHDNPSRFLAAGLAVLAGFIDAIGFLSLGGFFVSFMSGNSTRFAVSLTENGLGWKSLLPLAIIVLFVLGVMLGRVVRHCRRKRPSPFFLLFVSGALILASLVNEIDAHAIAASFCAVAMGAANNAFVRDGEVSVGVTYMTGTLVKFGQRLAGRLLGDKGSEWHPYLVLWMSLVFGAILGAALYQWLGLRTLWGAAFFSVTLAIAASRLEKYPSTMA